MINQHHGCNNYAHEFKNNRSSTTKRKSKKLEKGGGVKKYDFQDFQIFTCPPVIMGGWGGGSDHPGI